MRLCISHSYVPYRENNSHLVLKDDEDEEEEKARRRRSCGDCGEAAVILQ